MIPAYLPPPKLLDSFYKLAIILCESECLSDDEDHFPLRFGLFQTVRIRHSNETFDISKRNENKFLAKIKLENS